VTEKYRRTGRFVFEVYEDGCFVVGAARGADLEKIVGDMGVQQGSIFANSWLQELFFDISENVG
jgi:hypothetical protein